MTAVDPREHGQRGMADAERHLRDEDRTTLTWQLREWARSKEPFTANHVRRSLGPLFVERLDLVPNAMGAAFRAAARAGLIRRTGKSVPSMYGDARGRFIPEWIGVAK